MHRPHRTFSILAILVLLLLSLNNTSGKTWDPSRDSVEFSCTLVGESPSRFLRIENKSGRQLNGVQVVLPGNPFKVDGVPTGPFTVQAGQSVFMTVQFIPGRIGTWTDSIGITGGGEREVIRLRGVAVNRPGLQAFPTRLPLDFGIVAVGDTAFDTLSYGSSGCRELVVLSATLLGSSDFRIVSPISYPDTIDQSRRSMIVAFSPSAVGGASAAYRATTRFELDNRDIDGIDTTIYFTGEGVLKGLSRRPDSIWFDTVSIYSSPPVRALVIGNSDVIECTVHSISIVGTGRTAYDVSSPATPFLLRGRGDPGINPADTVVLQVDFTPDTPGLHTAEIVISTTSGEYRVPLSGVGISPPQLEITPHKIEFGPVMVGGRATLVDTVRLINFGGGGTVHIDSVVVGGPDRARFDATVSPASPTDIDEGDTVQITVSFSPDRLGKSVARVFFFMSSNERLTLDLEGEGTPPGIFVTPRRVNFGSIPLQTLSSVRTVDVVNLGGIDEQIDSVALVGPDFTEFEFLTRPLPMRLRSGGRDTLRVLSRFAPVGTPGLKAAALRVYFGAQFEDVELRGNAVSIGPSLRPRIVTFGKVLSGTTATLTDTLVLSNPAAGGMAFVVDSISLAGDDSTRFTIQGPTGVSVPAGAQTAYTLTFSPDAVRSFRTRALLYLSNGLTVPALALGEGIRPGFQVTTTQIVFPPQPLGTTSPEQTATIRNISDVDRVLDSAVIVGPDSLEFAISRRDGPIIGAAGANDTWNAQITFTPRSTGVRTATLRAYLNGGEIASIPMQGTGLLDGVTVVPGEISFGDVHVDSTSTITSAATLTNNGAVPLLITGVALQGNDPSSFSFDLVGGPATVPIGGSVTLRSSFTPTEVRSYGAIGVIVLAGGDEVDIPLTGAGYAPDRITVRLDTVYTAVSVTRPFRAIVDPPLTSADGVVGFKATLSLRRESIHVLSTPTAGVSTDWGEGDTLIVTGSFGAPLSGSELFRFEFEGLVSGRADNPVSVVDFSMSGTQLEASMEGGLIVLSGCEISRPTAFGRSARIATVSPNPISGQASLTYTAPEGQRPWVRVIDVMGYEVRRFELADGTGFEQNVALDLTDVDAGFYFLELRLGTQRSSAPIVVTR